MRRTVYIDYGIEKREEEGLEIYRGDISSSCSDRVSDL